MTVNARLERGSADFVCSNLIAGSWRLPGGAEERELREPARGSVRGAVRFSSAADVDAAVGGAAGAFSEWRRTPLKERSRLLFQFRELLLAHLDELSQLASAEAGKTVAEARAGLEKGIEVAEFALSIQNLDRGGAMEVSRGVVCEYRREPLGVVVGVTPFNFPAMVPLWLIPIAVTLGNAFILKPSEKVPQTACRLGELMQEAGYPAGVFSIVHGGRETAEQLAAHPGIAAFAFVGSTPAARSLYRIAGDTGKRALCLGGAKNQLIVVPDADPELTVEGVVSSFTGCAGQRCMAASVLIAVGEADNLILRIAERARTLQLGRDMGALIDADARNRLTAAVERAALEGATLLVDGRTAPPPPGCEQGNWLGPTVLDHVRPDMESATAELFGPVLSIIRVRTLQEALALEARSIYGNATSVFTTSGAVARTVSEQAQAGMVGVNIGVPVPREPFSFGGTKSSKFGAGDITGESSLEFWSNRKKVTTKWAAQRDGSWMS